MEFVSYHHSDLLLLLPVSTVSAQVDFSNTMSFKFKITISDSGQTMLIYCQENSCRQNFYHSLSFQIQKPKGHTVIILVELARGTHLLFSLYAFSHIVPFHHLPSGFGWFISHCLDKARDA